MILPEPNQPSQRSIRSISVEKPGFPESDYRILFDDDGKPLSYSSISSDELYRSFEYSTDHTLIAITDYSPQEQTQQFHYSNNRLVSQTAEVNQSEILLEYIYNDEEVQVLRFIDNLYHSTIFFVFSDPSLEFLLEIKSYDGVGQLRHHYLMEYDTYGNVISEEHFRYDFVLDELVLEKRIEQQYDQLKNPLYETGQPGWMPAWYMAHLDSESFIENISRFAPYNVLTRSIVMASGQSKTTSFQYEYDAQGFPLNCTRLTDGEFDLRKYRFEYYYN